MVRLPGEGEISITPVAPLLAADTQDRAVTPEMERLERELGINDSGARPTGHSGGEPHVHFTAPPDGASPVKRTPSQGGGARPPAEPAKISASKPGSGARVGSKEIGLTAEAAAQLVREQGSKGGKGPAKGASPKGRDLSALLADTLLDDAELAELIAAQEVLAELRPTAQAARVAPVDPVRAWHAGSLRKYCHVHGSICKFCGMTSVSG